MHQPRRTITFPKQAARQWLERHMLSVEENPSEHVVCFNEALVENYDGDDDPCI